MRVRELQSAFEVSLESRMSRPAVGADLTLTRGWVPALWTPAVDNCICLLLVCSLMWG